MKSLSLKKKKEISINNIINSCNQATHQTKSLKRYQFNQFSKLHKSLSIHSPLHLEMKQNSSQNYENSCFLKRRNLLKKCQQVKYLKTNDFSTITDHKSHKKFKTTSLFCEDITVGERSKQKFRQSLNKYKKNYFPTNASKGQRCTTDHQYHKKTSKILDQKDSFNMQELKFSLKKTSIVIRVLQQNNRKKSFIINNKKKHLFQNQQLVSKM